MARSIGIWTLRAVYIKIAPASINVVIIMQKIIKLIHISNSSYRCHQSKISIIFSLYHHISFLFLIGFYHKSLVNLRFQNPIYKYNFLLLILLKPLSFILFPRFIPSLGNTMTLLSRLSLLVPSFSITIWLTSWIYRPINPNYIQESYFCIIEPLNYYKKAKKQLIISMRYFRYTKLLFYIITSESGT